MDILLPPDPFHLSTLGLFDSEIGKSTLGYIVGPPIVPRFPAEGIVQEMAWLARVEPQGDWWAKAQGQSWRGVLDTTVFDLEGLFGSTTHRAVVEAREEFLAIIQQADDLLGAVESIEESASVQPDGSVGAVEDGADSATVQEAVPVGTVKDKPGEGCC
ncbi:MAG: hypothetical protein JRG69_13830 [Deltaproteobacteria bacterium]|nr:hypothetical protein [Deltaproteobacteria bacterium]